ncbi:MAG: tetratricopeptide repeat protein, partial [Bacteroidota bacterium]
MPVPEHTALSTLRLGHALLAGLLLGILVCGPWVQAQESEAAPGTSALEARLPTLPDAERVPILAELVERTHRSAPERAIAFGRDALVFLDDYPDIGLQAQVLFRKGLAHAYLAENDSVLAHAAMLRNLPAGLGRADAAFLEGRVYRRQGDSDAALRAFGEARSGYETAQDSAGIATTLRLIGLMYRQQGDFDRALELYDQARRLYEAIGDSVGLANTLSSTSIVLRRRGNSEGARDLLTRALALTESANDERAMSIVLNNLGLVYESLGDYDGALAAYTRSLTLKEATDDVRGIVRLLSNIGSIYLDQEAYADAQAMFERVLRLQ